MDPVIVLVCLAHSSAVGPFDTIDEAWVWIEKNRKQSECNFEALPMVQPKREWSPKGGYL